MSRLFSFIIFLLFLFFSLFGVTAFADIVPSHVFQKASILERQLIKLRAFEKITDTPKVPSVQVGKLPIHVFSKSLEVRDKLARLQTKYGLPVMSEKSMPLRKITPLDAFEVVDEMVEALSKVLSQKGISVSTDDIAFEEGKTPSNTYEKLWQVSYLFDALVGPIDPKLVYANVMVAKADLTLIAEKLGKSMITGAEPEAGTLPHHSNIEGFRNLYRLAKLERKLGIPAVRVADFPIGKIEPSDVYDMIKNISVELVRIKVKLGITTQSPSPVVIEGKTPSHILAELKNFGKTLDALAQ